MLVPEWRHLYQSPPSIFLVHTTAHILRRSAKPLEGGKKGGPGLPSVWYGSGCPWLCIKYDELITKEQKFVCFMGDSTNWRFFDLLHEYWLNEGRSLLSSDRNTLSLYSTVNSLVGQSAWCHAATIDKDRHQLTHNANRWTIRNPRNSVNQSAWRKESLGETEGAFHICGNKREREKDDSPSKFPEQAPSSFCCRVVNKL